MLFYNIEYCNKSDSEETHLIKIFYLKGKMSYQHLLLSGQLQQEQQEVLILLFPHPKQSLNKLNMMTAQSRTKLNSFKKASIINHK